MKWTSIALVLLTASLAQADVLNVTSSTYLDGGTYNYDSVNITGMLYINGDTTINVTGDFTMGGGFSYPMIQCGAMYSSNYTHDGFDLTIKAGGDVTLRGQISLVGRLGADSIDGTDGE